MDDVSRLILELARINRRFWVKSASYSTALAAVLASHERGHSPTRAQVEQAIAQGVAEANATIDSEYDQLEQVLLDGSDFRIALKRYVDKHK